MGIADWDHFQQWLRYQHLDILAIQETHWGYSSEWVQTHYHCVHSGLNNRQAGVMLLVAKHVCSLHDISWSEVIPGRLLHLRIHCKQRSFDFLNVYQHIHAPQTMIDRQNFWNQLHQYLSQLPKRNCLLLMGDFNTSLQKQNQSVGLPHYRWQHGRSTGPNHSDSDELLHLAQIYDLIALNTWQPGLGPTFQFGAQHSRIDYFFYRRHLVDACAKNVVYLSDFPLLGLSGAQHTPMVCNILKAWTPEQTSTNNGWSRAQRRALYEHWRKQDPHSQQLQQRIHAQISLLPTEVDDRLHTVHTCLNQHTGMQYTSLKPHPIYEHDLTPFQTFQWHTEVLRTLTQRPNFTMMNIFKAWHHLGRRTSARRAMNATSKAARKRRLMHIYDMASKAETAKDPFQFYQCIRELSPKIPYRRVLLRSATGELLAPVAAADALQQWLHTLYAASDSSTNWHCMYMAVHTSRTSTWSQNLPAFKALDPNYVPAPFWKMASSPLAQYLHPYFVECCHADALPSVWGHGTLSFIPKPGTKGQHAADLRPIILLEPSGKAILGVFSQHLLHCVMDRL